jgi:hypothetical protein
MNINDLKYEFINNNNTSLIFDTANQMRITNQGHSYAGKIGQSLTSFIELDLSVQKSIATELWNSLHDHLYEDNPTKELCDYAFNRWSDISGSHPYFFDQFEDMHVKTRILDEDVNDPIVSRVGNRAHAFQGKRPYVVDAIEELQNEYRGIVDYCLVPDNSTATSQGKLFQYMQDHTAYWNVHKTYVPVIQMDYIITDAGIEEAFRFENMSDVCFVELLHCIQAGIKYRRCDHCNRYFDVTKYPNTLYCDRIMPGKTKRCNEMGRTKKFDQVHKDDILGEYRKAYKTHYARYRMDILPDRFNAWINAANSKKNLVIQGQLSKQEYIEWLNSDKKTKRSRGVVPKHQPTSQ